MTFDVIAAARRRSRRLLLVVAGTAVAICALVYPLGLYANSRLDDNALPAATANTGRTSASPAPSPVHSAAGWPAGAWSASAFSGPQRA